MGFAGNYFLRHTFLIPQITEPPSGLLSYCVVIPSYLEDDLLSTLNGLKQTDRPKGDIEVLIVINFSESDSDVNKEKNLEQYHELVGWCESHSDSRLRFWSVLAADLPKKHAGAGLARKIGMDLALKRFNQINNPDGWILSLDADTKVEKNYFIAIEGKLKYSNNDFGGCIITFAHSLDQDTFTEDVKKAIISYELHLRYYKNILQTIGFPFARYTIGSCFGVKAGVYARHGGMNRRKAGEDFYFLNKLFPHEKFAEVNETCVYPSSRPSQRAPFGTGPVIHKMVSSGESEFLTYHPQAFYDLEKMLASVSSWFDMKPEKLKFVLEKYSMALQEFLIKNSFLEKIKEIQQNTASQEAFRKRFFLWFDGFRVVKYLNFAHSNYYSKIPVQQAVLDFLAYIREVVEYNDKYNLLLYLRKRDIVN